MQVLTAAATAGDRAARAVRAVPAAMGARVLARAWRAKMGATGATGRPAREASPELPPETGASEVTRATSLVPLPRARPLGQELPAMATMVSALAAPPAPRRASRLVDQGVARGRVNRAT